MNGWIDGWMDGRTDERTDGWMDGSMDGSMDRWIDGSMDGFYCRVDGLVIFNPPLTPPSVLLAVHPVKACQHGRSIRINSWRCQVLDPEYSTLSNRMISFRLNSYVADGITQCACLMLF